LAVLAFAFAVALLTGILFGLAPAWMTARAAPAEALRGAGRSTGRGGWTQKSLVVAQAALSLVLLSAAGLLTQSLRNMHGQNFGFETGNRYILHIDPQMARYKPAQLETLYRTLRDSLSAIPGVEQVSFSMYSPMEGDNWGETVFIEGQAPPAPDSDQNNASWLRVSDGYFETIGTKIIRGRSTSAQDSSISQHVAVVNQTFAKRFFKDGDPIGKHFGDFDMKHAGDFEIVGVSEDTQYREPTRKIPPMFFLPATQRVAYDNPRFLAFEDSNHYLNAIELKTRGKVPGLESQVRRALADVNPDLAVIDFMTFAKQVDGNFTQQAMIAKLTSLFGFLALILASIGLYGVTAYSVERRTNEIGIRMALGADRSSVLKLVLRGALAQMGIALAIGIPATIAAGRAMSAQLFGVKPYDLRILAVTTAALVLAAFLAALVPARRAATLDPIRALHTE
jgi:predicted permease